MNDRYTDAVLNRANCLQQAENAAFVLLQEDRMAAVRAAIAAAIGTLIALYPTVSAATALL